MVFWHMIMLTLGNPGQKILESLDVIDREEMTKARRAPVRHWQPIVDANFKFQS